MHLPIHNRFTNAVRQALTRFALLAQPTAEFKVTGYIAKWGGLRPPNPYRVPGNYCNNAREGEPHQGAKEKARRLSQRQY